MGRVGGWWAVGREGEGTARGREGGHYIHGREKAHIHAKVPTLRSLLLRHTRHCNPLSIYTRIYITSNVRENHLIAENPSKMGLRETAVGENIASNLRLYIYFFFVSMFFIF